MWLLWDWMGSEHWEFHGLVLWAMHWDSMDLHLGLAIGNSIGVVYGYAIVMSAGDSYGLAWLMLHRSTMDVPSVKYIGIPPHVASMGVGCGLIIGNSMALFYG